MKQIVILSHARKSYNSRVVLDDVTLAFRLGAKIGVVGPNGTGKSTLLWMMAGVEQPSNGEARLMPGYTVGLLTQEPELDETRTVLGNVEEGVAGTRALVERLHEVAASWPPIALMSCWTRWAGCRSNWISLRRGTWTAGSGRRWTRCAARRRTWT
jgi:ATPase subunit of ABC transporter with duplicated ATPase domains